MNCEAHITSMYVEAPLNSIALTTEKSQLKPIENSNLFIRGRYSPVRGRDLKYGPKITENYYNDFYLHKQ